MGEKYYWQKKTYNTVVTRAPTKNQVKQLNFSKHFNNLSKSRFFSVWGLYFQVKIYLLNWICVSLPWIIPWAIVHMQISKINLEFQFSLFSHYWPNSVHKNNYGTHSFLKRTPSNLEYDSWFYKLVSALKIKPIKTSSHETSQMFKIQLLGKNSKYNIKNKNNSLERIKYKRKNASIKISN